MQFRDRKQLEIIGIPNPESMAISVLARYDHAIVKYAQL